jgi:hypothetical protein
MIVPRPGTLGRVILQILTLLVDSIKREGEWLLIYCGRSRKKVLFRHSLGGYQHIVRLQFCGGRWEETNRRVIGNEEKKGERDIRKKLRKQCVQSGISLERIPLSLFTLT